jgi:DNA-directed RNA polymerase specialized sigma24 family protein
VVKEKEVDLTRCEALAERVAMGDVESAELLRQELWPWLDSLVRSSNTMRPFADSHDDVAKALDGAVRKISGGLRLYPGWRESHPTKTILDWMRIVAKNSMRDYVRSQLGRRPTREGEIGAKRLLNEFASSDAIEDLPTRQTLGTDTPFAQAQTVRELIAFAKRRLAVDQLQALACWLKGNADGQIAEELGVSVADAKRKREAAVAVLRRHFRPSKKPSRAS